MSAAFRLIFIATYLLSGYDTTLHRVSYIVGEIQHAGARIREISLGVPIPCNVQPNYTHFSEAKKATAESGCELAAIPSLAPSVSFGYSTFPPISRAFQRTVFTPRSRAPPVL